MTRWVAAMVSALIVLFGIPSSASAGIPVEWVAGCWSEHHGGPPYANPHGDPIVDTLSAVDGAGTIDGAPPNAPFEIDVVGPGGFQETLGGDLDPQSRFEWAAGINQGGTYSVDDLRVEVDGAMMPVPAAPDVETSYTVEPPREVECRASDLPPGQPGAATETSTSSSTAAPEVDEDPEEEEEEAGDEDDGFPWEVLTFTGLGIFGLGIVLWLLARRGRPCIEELRAWQAAKDACEKARERQRQAEEDLDDARDERETAEDDLEDLCEQYPPACRPESWIEDADTGERVTSADLWVNRQWAKQAWDRYRDAPSEERARQTEEAWKDGPPDDWADRKREELDQARKRHDELEKKVEEARQAEERAEKAAREAREAADEACRDAEKKRQAYEECVGAEVEKAAEEAPPSGGPEGPGAPVGPGGPATVAKPEEGGPCEEGDERAEELAKFGPRDVAADFSIIATPDGMHGFQDGGELAVRLGQLATELDAAFDLLSGAGAGKAAAGGRYGSAGLQAQGTVTDIPSSIPDAIGEVLEFTAELGATVAGSVDRWMEGHESFNVRSPVFVWRIEARWLEVWRCENGQWKCRRELEFKKGRLRRTQYHRDADVTAPNLARELQRRAVGLRNKVQSDLEAVQEFLNRHTPGPCS